MTQAASTITTENMRGAISATEAKANPSIATYPGLEAIET